MFLYCITINDQITNTACALYLYALNFLGKPLYWESRLGKALLGEALLGSDVALSSGKNCEEQMMGNPEYLTENNLLFIVQSYADHMLVTCRSRDITSVNKILDLQPFILSLLTYLSPVYTTLNFWYGTDKSGTRTTFLVLGLPI